MFVAEQNQGVILQYRKLTLPSLSGGRRSQLLVKQRENVSTITRLLVDGKLIVIDPKHRPFINKYSLTDIRPITYPKTMLKLEQFQEKIREHNPSLDVFSWMFIQHHYCNKSLAEIARIVEINKKRLYTYFDHLGLPYIKNKQEIDQRNRQAGKGYYQFSKQEQVEQAKQRYAQGIGIGGYSHQQHSENGIKGGHAVKDQGKGIFNPESRHDNNVKGGKACQAKFRAEKRGFYQGREKFSEWGKKGGHILGLMTRANKTGIYSTDADIQRRVHEGRLLGARRRREVAQRRPNGLESIFIDLLKHMPPVNGHPIFTQSKTEAQPGQIYNSDHNDGTSNNITVLTLKKVDANEKRIRVIPDFKVKGKRAVIEIWGDYYHSQEWVEKNDQPSFKYNEQEMIDEYAKIGYTCLIIREHVLRDLNNHDLLKSYLQQWLASLRN